MNKLENALDNLESYYYNLNDKKNILDSEIEFQQRLSKCNKNLLRKKIGSLVLSTTLILSAITGSFLGSYSLSREKKYHLHKDTYDSISRQIKQEDYLYPKVINSYNIYENVYFDKISSKRNGQNYEYYYNGVVNYDISYYMDITLEKILEMYKDGSIHDKLNYDYISYSDEDKITKASEVSDEDIVLYTTSYYSIEKITSSDEDYEMGINNAKMLKYESIFIIIIFLICLLIRNGLDDDYKPSINKLIEAYDFNKKAKIISKKQKEDIKVLLKEALEFIENNKQLLQEKDQTGENIELLNKVKTLEKEIRSYEKGNC